MGDVNAEGGFFGGGSFIWIIVVIIILFCFCGRDGFI
jgi:hypothetical protein